MHLTLRTPLLCALLITCLGLHPGAWQGLAEMMLPGRSFPWPSYLGLFFNLATAAIKALSWPEDMCVFVGVLVCYSHCTVKSLREGACFVYCCVFGTWNSAQMWEEHNKYNKYLTALQMEKYPLLWEGCRLGRQALCWSNYIARLSVIGRGRVWRVQVAWIPCL